MLLASPSHSPRWLHAAGSSSSMTSTSSSPSRSFATMPMPTPTKRKRSSCGMELGQQQSQPFQQQSQYHHDHAMMNTSSPSSSSCSMNANTGGRGLIPLQYQQQSSSSFSQGLEDESGTEARLGDGETTRGKRSRLAGMAPSLPSHQLPSSPSNVPFSAAFRSSASNLARAQSSNRPPTVEEQQSWASSSSSPNLDESTPAAGIFSTAQSQWIQVQTDYGHGFVKRTDAAATRPPVVAPRPAEDLNAGGMNEDLMTWDGPSESSVASTSSARSSFTASGPFTPLGEHPAQPTLWSKIEGDTEMETDSTQTMVGLQASSRSGDWTWGGDGDEDCEVDVDGSSAAAASIQQEQPQQPQQQGRAHLGAGYFDQMMMQAGR